MKFIILCFVIYGVSSQTVEYIELEQYYENLEIWNKEIAALPFVNLKRVLVCLNDESKSHLGQSKKVKLFITSAFHDFNFEYHDISSCYTEITNDDVNSQKKTIIAVVAPFEPFNSFELSSKIPMYFYDTPYIYDDEADAFPNGFAPHQKHWKLLAHAFAHHITKNGWKRIAVVSDNSPRSLEFERELEGQMKEKGLVYTLQGCIGSTSSCHFDKAMRYLKQHGAVIIIANVEREYSLRLADSASRYGLDSYTNLWLVRDWPFTKKPFTHAISFTLTPKSASIYTEGLPQLKGIWHGLNLISEAVKSEPQTGNIDDYYRSIGIKIKKEETPVALIRRYSSQGFPHLLESLIIHKSGAVQSTESHDGLPFLDLSEYCLLRSNSYEDPCNDVWGVLILIVWMIFVLLLFLIIFLFNKCTSSNAWT